MMAQPWFSDPNTFGALYGGIVGGVGGTLCGVLGGLAGSLAPKGKGRTWILGIWKAMIAFGGVNLLVGIAALASGQPYAIWYPFLLCGFILSVVMGALYPVLLRRYEEAEQRRIEAASFRQG
jgi:hypothetical protein